MEHNHIASPTASTHEHAVPSSNDDRTPEKPLFVPSMVSRDLNTTFPPPEPGSRRIRHDGWTPDRIAGFIEALAACGVVADACKSVGLSTQSAYAFRNRRAGRAFAVAWEAVLIHRGRARLGDELLSRSMNGCVEAVHRDGEIVGERHRHDNRLSMAVLTRLDRLAERAGDRDAHLRNVSEDMEDYLDLVEAGGDADAFIEARRPPPELERVPEPAPARAPGPCGRPVGDDHDRMAKVMGSLGRRSEHAFHIDLADLEELEKEEWSADQMLRAHYSGYLDWLDLREADADADADDPEAEESDDSPPNDSPPNDSPSAYKARFADALRRHAARVAGSAGSPGARTANGRDRDPNATQPSTSST